MMKRFLAAIAAALMITALFGCGNSDSASDFAEEQPTDEPQLELIIASNQLSEENPYHFGLAKFKETAESLSNGRISVICHDGTLSENEDELIEMLKSGECQMIVASPGFMTDIGVPEVEMLSLLYLFDSFDHWENALDGEFGRMMRDVILEKTGNSFRIMGYWSAGVRDYYGKKPIKTVADVKNLTIRTQTSGVVSEFWNQCGAVPLNVAWGNLYDALRLGVVDSAENDYTNFMLKEHHKTQNGKYICETHHDFTTRLFMINGDFYDSLTPQQRDWINDAADAASAEERRVTYSMLDYSKENVIAEGGVVTEFKDIDIEAFKAIAIPIQDKFAADNKMESYLKMVRKAK